MAINPARRRDDGLGPTRCGCKVGSIPRDVETNRAEGRSNRVGGCPLSIGVRSAQRQLRQPKRLINGKTGIALKTVLTASKCFYLELTKSPQGNVCCARALSRCWSGPLCHFDRGVKLTNPEIAAMPG